MFRHSRAGGNPEENGPDFRSPGPDAKQLSPGSIGGKELKDNAAAKLTELHAALQPVFDQLASLEAELVPYELIKTALAAARARYRDLTSAFVDELKQRCTAINDEEKQALVLELFSQDVQAGLDAAVNERRQELVRFIEGLWEKYQVALTELMGERSTTEELLDRMFEELGYQ